jgi:hypothetical protein
MLNMKKIYALLMLALPMLGFAQTAHVVTFKVNTANITVGANGLFLGGGVIGGANAVQLTDPDGNGVYEGTDTLDGTGGGNFIFLNSPANNGDWGTKESLNGLPCADPSNYDDRILPSFTQDTTLMFCFGTCATDTVCPTPLTPVDVTFQSDRSNSPAFTNAYLSGTFPVSWDGTAYPMTDTDGDGVYTVVMSLTPGDYRYKFTADNWAIQENFVPASMSDITCINTNSAGFTDRVLTVGTSDTTLMIHAWEECGGSNIGVEEVAASFTVKPNPASDVLFIENTTGTTTSVAVYNVTGAKVMEESFEANTRLDVATLPRGMYIVRLQNEETDSVIRISLN